MRHILLNDPRWKNYCPRIQRVVLYSKSASLNKRKSCICLRVVTGLSMSVRAPCEIPQASRWIPTPTSPTRCSTEPLRRSAASWNRPQATHRSLPPHLRQRKRSVKLFSLREGSDRNTNTPRRYSLHLRGVNLLLLFDVSCDMCLCC